MSPVLVTGGSGFIAGHCIVQLLAAGYEVRATLRNLAREPQVRAMLAAGGAHSTDRVSFFPADLKSDAGWRDAVAGCDYVLHVASPLPPGPPKTERELIVPARDGALRVLRAARDAGVKRVVLTSSFAAIGYGHAAPARPFDECDWTDLDSPGLAPYPKSKTLAERAAWDFVAKEGGGLELAVVNPVAVLGPVLAPDFSASILLVKRLMDGSIPGLPNLYFGVVDVRDVAHLHVLAMTHGAAKGERFLAVAGDFMVLKDVAGLLKSRMGGAARRVPTLPIPNLMVRLVGLFDPAVRLILPELGKVKNANSDKARRLLNWTPRPGEEAILATAESLLRLRLLKP